MNPSNKTPYILCPYCHVHSQMEVVQHHFNADGVQLEIHRCTNCGGKFFYIAGKLMYPEP